MPRSPSEYSRREWLRLRPIVDSYKHYRHQLLAAYLVRRRARGGDLPGAVRQIQGADVLLTVAFNDPRKIQMQASLIRAFVPDAAYVVLDNSNDDRVAEDIRMSANAHRAAYVRLPPAPWRDGNAGRAHALAMNWAWRHLILKAKPRAFGFIDHDIYPVRATDPFKALQSYPVAGRVWHRPPRWHLWAGFCFFRFDAVRHNRLDFGRDWLASVDTGGRNWWHLYRYLDAAKVTDPGVRREAVLPGYNSDECGIEWLGDWLHESHFSNLRQDLQAEKERAIRKLISQ